MAWKLFKRSFKANIGHLELDPQGWTLEDDTPEKRAWSEPNGVAYLSLHYFPVTPDLPQKADLTALREFYRNSLKGANGGLIKADWVTFNGLRCVETLIKLPQEPNGICYLASYILPFSNCSFVLKMQAMELGITGTRESIMVERLLNDEVIEITPEGQMKNWWVDPYDPNLTDGFIMSLAEQEQYDKDFPNHHLTLLRQWMQRVGESVTLSPELAKLEPWYAA